MAFSGVMSQTAFAQAPAFQARSGARQCAGARIFNKANFVAQLGLSQSSFNGVPMKAHKASKRAARAGSKMMVLAIKDGATLDRPLRVAVVGGGPAGASAADTLAKNGIETYLLERKMDNCKVSALFATPARSRNAWRLSKAL